MLKIKISSVAPADGLKIQDEGVATALVVRRDSQQNPRYYLMSCLHVYGLLRYNANQYQNTTYIYDSKNTHIATYKGLCGSLHTVNKGLWSFDMALAEVENSQLAELEKVFSELPKDTWNALTKWPKSTPICIKTDMSAKTNASNLQLLRGNQQRVFYRANPDFSAAFRTVVKYQTDTQPGDSGSPVVTDKHFLGMHIAGNGTVGYMLPAEDIINNAHLFIKQLNGDQLSLL